ncbi:hypothetical protein GW943_02985 [Candidatus Parcubacteria bacterium]|uniref:Dipeptidylpeptidase IV N-terminal domain-containing protein n=1 Tax=Candidatus Kaiserbacteria bacterium CG10_big_fil_rev_8_21_14_0_10_47_16 TaxID=1974608 RepID=A0A2H0UE59_9BACT|nr:hypothetical protein [Candidatus Parcubacteria bacterium]PIR84640.1 MAG: hypothetical protein COU16_03650 [Candidatus Kaiserbacteria bacterium CG10_big_fil_rev_8_21_14_0_10_47_16]
MDTTLYTQPEGYGASKSTKASIPTAFVIITVIVGAVWHVYQQGGLQFLPLDRNTAHIESEGNLLPGDIMFFTKTPLEYPDGTQTYGVALHSSDGVVSDVVPITPELPMTDVSSSPRGDMLAVVYNGFGREPSRIEIITIDGRDRQVVAEADDVFFSTPVWSGDGESILYARNTLDHSLPREDVVAHPSKRELVRLSLRDSATATIGEGIPIGLSYDGTQSLLVNSSDELVMTNADGTQKVLAPLGSFEYFESSLSQDGRTVVVVVDDRVQIMTLNWKLNTVEFQTAFNDVVMSSVFDQGGTPLLLFPNGTLRTYALTDLGWIPVEKYTVRAQFQDGAVKLLRWNNTMSL